MNAEIAERHNRPPSLPLDLLAQLGIDPPDYARKAPP
jgi:hypothetical protein